MLNLSQRECQTRDYFLPILKYLVVSRPGYHHWFLQVIRFWLNKVPIRFDPRFQSIRFHSILNLTVKNIIILIIYQQIFIFLYLCIKTKYFVSGRVSSVKTFTHFYCKHVIMLTISSKLKETASLDVLFFTSKLSSIYLHWGSK